jgi:hypothetical protein
MLAKAIAGGCPCRIEGSKAVLPLNSRVRLGGPPPIFCKIHRSTKKRSAEFHVICRLQDPYVSPDYATGSASETGKKRILSTINRATKYATVLICIFSAAGIRSIPLAWALTGSIVSIYICKVRGGDTANPYLSPFLSSNNFFCFCN